MRPMIAAALFVVGLSGSTWAKEPWSHMRLCAVNPGPGQCACYSGDGTMILGVSCEDTLIMDQPDAAPLSARLCADDSTLICVTGVNGLHTEYRFKIEDGPP